MATRVRKSLRVPGFDYSQAGAYFVTMATYKHKPIFGVIEDGQIRLNDFGMITDECWCALTKHFRTVELGAHIVMPNHVHGIIIINDTVGARHASPLREEDAFTRPRGVVPGSLGAIVGSFKSAVTKRIGTAVTEIWQRNYYDHIIRDEEDMKNKTDYIEANALLWEQEKIGLS